MQQELVQIQVTLAQHLVQPRAKPLHFSVMEKREKVVVVSMTFTEYVPMFGIDVAVIKHLFPKTSKTTFALISDLK